MGGLISKLPTPLFELAIEMIQIFPPNVVFKKLHYYFDRYYLTQKIFNFNKKAITLGDEFNKNRKLFLEKE
jgi:hypothetical protein